MNEQLRGFIEKTLDEISSKGKLLDNVRWIEDVLPIRSLEDLALGYAIGSGERFSQNIVIMGTGKEPTDEDYTEIRKMMERRLPEIAEKINRELNR